MTEFKQIPTVESIETAPATLGNVVIGVTATGPISAVTNVPLSFKGSGKLTALKVNVGDSVTPGQVLATLDTTDLQTALDQAKATLVQAQANLAKVQAGPTGQAIAAAQTSVDNAKQTVLDSQATLDSTKAGNTGDIAASQLSVVTAQTGVKTASDSLAAAQDQLVKGVAADQAAIATDQKALAGLNVTIAADQPILLQAIAQAKNNLYTAQISRDVACGKDRGGPC
jgi:multidrug efflux pump subunit AcrA (membrane-fusion protein)